MIDVHSSGRVLARFAADLASPGPGPLTAPLDLSRHAPADVAAARYAWALRVADEYRSVVVFSELLERLAGAAAPYECLVATQRLIGDELRHTKLCANAIDALGGWDGIDVDLSGLGLPRTGEPAAVRAYEIIVRELVVAESESVGMIRAYHDACDEPYLASILRSLLQDEVRHAAAGRELARRVITWCGDGVLHDTRVRLTETVARDIESIRAVYRDSAGGGPGRALGGSIRQSDLPLPVDYHDVEELWYASSFSRRPSCTRR